MRIRTEWKLLWDIFISFLKISPVTFGGGYAMLPVIEQEVVEKRKWLHAEEMSNVISIAGSAPGGIGVNAAVFIGYRLASILGAIVATIGIMLPTFLIVLALILFFHQVSGNPKIIAAFEGIRMSIVALIAYAGVRIGKTSLIDKTTAVIGGVTVVILLLSFVQPVLMIPLGVVAGVIIMKLKEKIGVPVLLEQSEVAKYKETVGSQQPIKVKSAEKMVHQQKDVYFGDGI
ncbi:chromate transporter [Ferviditalea candida]|uniref:Chromate transporter n=1 Tax=Ferviditalea candida TaxID=3108399 RepID=A0ABU5ZG91_9BACL|nr:chromate transporter [Paenibacillaceae bacterium T2]